MIKRINNLQEYGIPTCGEPLYAYFASGAHAASRLKSVVEANYQVKNVILKASGMLDNLPAPEDYNGNLIYFEKGDASKFFIRKFPELLISIPNAATFNSMIDDWVCTCYERRIIYFTDPEHAHTLIDHLCRQKFDLSAHLEENWPLVDLVIENVLDAPCHDTFLIMAKKDLEPLFQAR